MTESGNTPPPPPPPNYSQPAPAAPAPAPAATSKKLGPIAWVLIIFGALVFVGIIAVLAVVFLLNSSSGSSSASPNKIADISDEPEEGWSYDFASSGDEFVSGSPSVVAVGDSHALIWADFDSWAFDSAQGDSIGWYEGYNEDYSVGYDSGLEYEEAIEAWINDVDFVLPYPYEEDFYPPEYEGSTPPDGWWDGFYDASAGFEYGFSEVSAPVEPDVDLSVTLLDLGNGDEDWTLDLEEIFPDYEPSNSFSATAVPEHGVIVFSSFVDDYTVLVAVDVDNGEEVSETEIDGSVQLLALDGRLFGLVSDFDSGDTWVMRADAANLDDDFIWEADADDAYYISPLGDYVAAYGDSEGFVFDAEYGDEIGWGRDLDDDTWFQYVDGHLLRFENFDGEYEITAIDDEGDETWDSVIDAEWAHVDQDVLVIGEYSSEGYDRLMRIDPANGEEMWDEEYRDEVSWVDFSFNNVLVASDVDGRDFIVIDAGNGEEIYTDRAPEFFSSWVGDSMFYLSGDGSLMAFETGDSGDVWEFRYDSDTEGIMKIGESLFLVDYDRRSITSLE